MRDYQTFVSRACSRRRAIGGRPHDLKTYTGLKFTLPDRSSWTLPSILSLRAQTFSARTFLQVSGTGESYTFAQVSELSERVAANLIRRGGSAGERVLVMVGNGSPSVFAWFGAAIAGMVHVPINTAYRGSFLEHQVRTVAPTLAIVDAEYAERFVESREAAASIKRFFVSGSPTQQGEASAALAAAGWPVEPFSALLEPASAALPEVHPWDPASIFFTSGTTGLSKGVTMAHGHLYFFADELLNLVRLTDADVYMGVGPLFHGNTTFLALLPSLVAGARFVLHEKFSASRWSQWVREDRITVTNFIGVMMDFVWRQPPDPRDADNRLRCIFAAPTAHSILEDFKKRFGVEAVVEVFGLTETSMPILTPYGLDRPPGACGLQVSEYFDVILVDPETDQEVATGEVGELLVRSKLPWTTTLGYFGMPERTLEAFRNLWFHTGDGLRRDSEGWFYFVDRLKDALRRRGENISSYEVEQAILPHPAIAECAVVAVPADNEAGEDEVMVYVVAETGSSLSAAELWEWCDRRLPNFTVPRYVKFVDQLPKTPSERVQKAVLRSPEHRAGALDRVRELSRS